MRLIASPIMFTPQEINEVAMLFHIPYKELEKVQVCQVSNDKIANLHYKNYEKWNNFYKVGDMVYVVNIGNNDNNAYHLAIAYYFLNGQTFQLEQAAKYYKQFQNIKRNVRSYRESIESYERSIQECYERLGNIQIVNISLLEKMAKKRGMEIEWINGVMNLTMKNITIGNEIEGHIKYKSITLRMGDKFSYKNGIFRFNDFYYDTQWGTSTVPLHPHISLTQICLGNRESDFELYQRENHYDLLLDFIKEIISEYDPHNPYISITKLANVLNTVRKLMPPLSEEHLTEEQLARKLFNAHLREITTCPICTNYYTNEDNICNATRCEANPNAEILCEGCNSPKIRKEWDNTLRKYLWECDTCYECKICGRTSKNSKECTRTVCWASKKYVETCIECNTTLTSDFIIENGVYKWFCPNVACENSPLFNPPPIPSEIRCEVCGEILMEGTDWFCSNDICPAKSISQKNKYGILLSRNKTSILAYKYGWDNAYCRQCGDKLTFDRLHFKYKCNNSGCSHSYQYEDDGNYRNITLIPFIYKDTSETVRCPDCASLIVRQDKKFICSADNIHDISSINLNNIIGVIANGETQE